MGQWIRRPGVEGDVKFSGRLGRGRVGNEWKIHLMNVRNDFGVGGSFQRFAVDLEDLVADLQIRFVRRRSCAIKQSVVTTFVSICGPFRPISANRIANDVSVFDAGVAAIRLAHKVKRADDDPAWPWQRTETRQMVSVSIPLVWPLLWPTFLGQQLLGRRSLRFY